jgi:hypothetical protein
MLARRRGRLCRGGFNQLFGPVLYPRPVYATPVYVTAPAPQVIYTSPPQLVVVPSPTPPPFPTVVQYPHGRYELRATSSPRLTSWCGSRTRPPGRRLGISSRRHPHRPRRLRRLRLLLSRVSPRGSTSRLPRGFSRSANRRGSPGSSTTSHLDLDPGPLSRIKRSGFSVFGEEPLEQTDLGTLWCCDDRPLIGEMDSVASCPRIVKPRSRIMAKSASGNCPRVVR